MWRLAVIVFFEPARREIATAFAAGLLVVLFASDGLAQRGGQHLNSPGYQRALIESRKPKAEVLPQATTLKKKRPRHPRTE